MKSLSLKLKSPLKPTDKATVIVVEERLAEAEIVDQAVQRRWLSATPKGLYGLMACAGGAGRRTKRAARQGPVILFHLGIQ